MTNIYNSMLKEFGDVLTVDELCSVLRIGRNTAYKLLNSGAVKNISIGRKHIIPKTSVIDFLIS